MKLDFGTHRIEYTTTAPVLVSLDDQPIGVLTTGKGKVVLRRVAGTLSVDNPHKAKLDWKIKSRKLTEGEELDDLPPPAPAAPSNYLARLRQAVADTMGTTREAFAEYTSIYEHGEVDLFEEELTEAQSASQAEKARTVADTNAEEQGSDAEGSQLDDESTPETAQKETPK